MCIDDKKKYKYNCYCYNTVESLFLLSKMIEI